MANREKTAEEVESYMHVGNLVQAYMLGVDRSEEPTDPGYRAKTTPFVREPNGPGHLEDCVALQGVPMCNCGATLATAKFIMMMSGKNSDSNLSR